MKFRILPIVTLEWFLLAIVLVRLMQNESTVSGKRSGNCSIEKRQSRNSTPMIAKVVRMSEYGHDITQYTAKRALSDSRQEDIPEGSFGIPSNVDQNLPQKPSTVRRSFTLQENGSLFIIGGTQKSGTTALAAYLSLHPNISMSGRKELHFFDKNVNYRKGIRDYLSNFHGNGSTVIYGEATPFYIASRVACQRISAHFPNVKMIILLREPVARAYSEYQMKARRVLDQEELIKLLSMHRETIRRCLVAHALDFKQIQRCVPQMISSHGRYGKFTKALKKSMAKLNDWPQVVDMCFPPKFLSLSNQRHVDLSKRLSGIIYLNRSSILLAPQREDISSSRRFHPRGCWQHYKEGLETLQPMHDAFFEEIEEFEACSSQIRGTSGTSTDEHEIRLQSWLGQVDEQIEKCVKVKGGISRQYIYRSLYAPQLFHCFKYIDKNQFLILTSESLKNNLAGTMDTVLQFLGLPTDLRWLPSKEHEDDVLVHVVKSKFASFERTTAWRLRSTYQPMNDQYKELLRSYFQPYNDLLYELVSRNFSSEW